MKKVLIAVAALCASAGYVLAQDVSSGGSIYNQCRSCHQVGETAKNSVGPVLNGLIGRKAGTREGYNYSEPLKASGLTWDATTFSEYIKNPKAKVPGTRMTFAGLRDPAKIADLVAFLEQYGDDGKKKP